MNNQSLTTYFQAIIASSAPLRSLFEEEILEVTEAFMADLFELKIKHGSGMYLYGFPKTPIDLCDEFRGISVVEAYYFEEFEYHIVILENNPHRRGYRHTIDQHADIIYKLGSPVPALKCRYVDPTRNPELDKTIATTLHYSKGNGAASKLKKLKRKELDTI